MIAADDHSNEHQRPAGTSTTGNTTTTTTTTMTTHDPGPTPPARPPYNDDGHQHQYPTPTTNNPEPRNDAGGPWFDGKDENSDSGRGTTGNRTTGATTTRTATGTGPRIGDLPPTTHPGTQHNPALLRATACKVDGWCHRDAGGGRDVMVDNEEEEGDGDGL